MRVGRNETSEEDDLNQYSLGVYSDPHFGWITRNMVVQEPAVPVAMRLLDDVAIHALDQQEPYDVIDAHQGGCVNVSEHAVGWHRSPT